MRGNCKQCFEDGEHSCSFEENPDQIVCEHCADNDYYCETLPPNGYKADRIDIYEVIGKQDRQHAQCTTCQQEKRRCSLKKMSDMPPCKYCKKNKIGCNFFHSPKVDHKRQRAATGKVKRPTEGDAPEVAMPGTDYFTAEDLADLEMRDEEMQSRYPTPEIEMEDNAGHKGILTKICTSFAHPIQFLTGEDGPSDCSFCEMPIFGVTGHYEREVHVIRWYNGLGFSEIGGGFCEENSCTRMCKSCTINRLQIILCSGHVLQPTLHDSFVQDFDALADELISADPGSSEMNYQLQRWCSMCFSIAAFGCVCIQPGLCGEEEMEIVGCGLRLCTRCEIALKQEFGDDIDLMAGEMEKSPKINMKDDQVGQLEGKVRADVSFLRTKGLLMNCVEADSSL
ncbi:hypothetical protein BKA66DRAFT_457565 [Pyrenochaeta sp. MPI-SDFR-AT-0127]|nr:hypothetical protein BKA66DRAFT_457565 [Pyrenochaeta sp. MPI-SDFR-AT-0127]